MQRGAVSGGIDAHARRRRIKVLAVGILVGVASAGLPADVSVFGTQDAFAAPSTGAGLGKLEGRSLVVTERGLAKVESLLAQFAPYEPNQAMVSRLRRAMEGGQRVTGADASFYIHELAESTMMGRGVPYAQAHAATLSKYSVSPYSVYHPDVISKYSEMFRSPWKQFWGIG